MPEIVVYVWRPSGDYVGHSSLQLSDGTYISWWPEGECDHKNPRAKASPMDSLEQDIEAEGDRKPNVYKIKVSNEEQYAIVQWWTNFKGKADYQFVSNNCSTVLYYAQEAAFPFLSKLNDEIPVWVPGAIEMVAEDLAAGKRSFDRKRIDEIKKAVADEVERLSGGSKKVNRFTIAVTGRK
ncbi:uncharacterized protein LOC132715893 isoform X2 [Ruditapes philippinarum]|uniref:uncharacterized protein LOC132715893 isoform X1 n=1 Tax=Ruditapes philippinarum TaxID=129788 RepID=UPI00295B7F07|nr:uncharacterized protein LOC132715893 isoform X1 [Ruditapes philippinarum]XP_060554979.1 uncharacterized protein LOC132715893 isoform X2 [Ruditapes philippinarum]